MPIKRMYETPAMDVVRLANSDVIVTSGMTEGGVVPDKPGECGGEVACWPSN